MCEIRRRVVGASCDVPGSHACARQYHVKITTTTNTHCRTFETSSGCHVMGDHASAAKRRRERRLRSSG